MKTQLKIRTEYSFRTAYGPVELVCKRLQFLGCEVAAIADRNSTFGHISWAKQCKAFGIKPIFGVELGFTDDITSRERRQNLYYLTLLARSNAGLRELYSAVEEATLNFYRVPRLPIEKLKDFSKDVMILSGNAGLGKYNNLLPKQTIIELHPATNNQLISHKFNCAPVSDNYMIVPDNRDVYEIVIGRGAFNRPSPMHILSKDEVNACYDDAHFEFADILGAECNATIEQATNIKTFSEQSLLQLCITGANEKAMVIGGEYLSRLQHELKLIQDKGFVDYFLVIADMVKYAKQNMLVGPARGSSCGSLVCYLLGITDIDPIPHGLIFERFIDVTRHDLPDIDIDFQDDKRELVFEYLSNKYGSDKVTRLGTVSRHKARSAINVTAKALSIPPYEAEQIADLIVKRNDGDERANQCILDTFTDTDAGKQFIAKYPTMMVAAKFEGHANYPGKHAAGVIVTNDPINHFVARDAHSGTAQIDKYDAEKINLMKIDLLGLRTLTIIADCLQRVGWTHADLLAHPLDDDAAFNILRKRLFCGVFQFEGQALQNLTRNVQVNQFSDLVSLTALARPGALISGAAYEWCARRKGKTVELLHPIMESITRETFGLIVFQEQMMRIVREVGGLSWEDVTLFRRGINKKLGMEYFDAAFWNNFKDGALAQGIDEVTARSIWETVSGAGDYVFNKSHSVAYAMVSYWCCVLKAHFPLDFAVSTLKQIEDAQHTKQYLRELDRAGYAFKIFDEKLSEYNWEVKDNVLVGGLTNIVGIGPKMADAILEKRKHSLPLTDAQNKRLLNGRTPYDDVFESRERFADLLAHPAKYGIVSKLWNLIDIPDEEGSYVFLAKVIKWKIRSLNEFKFLAERNGMKVPNDRWLTMTLEDDSDMMPASVSRTDFTRFGLPLTKRNSEDWYIFKAYVQQGNRRLYINKWKAI
jgi:DNA polymerase III alpha subunit